MFILGVLVGRGTAPVKFDIKKLSREIETLREADLKKQKAPVEVVTNEEKTKTTLGFYEELKKSEPAPVPLVKPRSSNVTSQEKTLKKKTTPAKTSPQVKKEPVSKPSSKIKKKQTKSPEKKPKSKTTTAVANSVKPTVSPAKKSKGMTIQVASLKELSEADALVKKLQAKGYPAYKTIAVVPDKGIWFRIRVGSYSSRESTNRMVGRLKKDGFRPMIVKRN
jgi:cell division septation protein DedD